MAQYHSNEIWLQVLPNITQTHSLLRESFDPYKNGEKLWEQCCQAAMQCCEKIKDFLPGMPQLYVNSDQVMDGGGQAGLYHRCPPTWDGWQCWPDGGKAGETSTGTCPPYIHFSAGASMCSGKSSWRSYIYMWHTVISKGLSIVQLHINNTSVTSQFDWVQNIVSLTSIGSCRKQCLLGGQWFKRNRTQQEFTDFAQCNNAQELHSKVWD